MTAAISTAAGSAQIPSIGQAAPGGVWHARFERARGRRPDPDLQSIWAERLPDVSIPLVPRGHSFTDMCVDLVAALRAAGPLELVVLAHVTPDLDARGSVAGALAAPGLLVFAVSDQGRLAPFTALRMAAAFPDRPHAAVIALDQAVVPYSDPDLSALDDQADHAVVLRPSMGFGKVRQWAGVTGDRVGDLLDDALRGERPDLVVLGPALPPPAGFRWRRAPGDQLGTAVFSALSEHVADRVATGEPVTRITVVEYEPALRGLALVTWSEKPRSTRYLTPVPNQPGRPDRT
jgi:hypothetical protein